MVYTTTVEVKVEIYSVTDVEVDVHSKAEVEIDVHTGDLTVELPGG